MWGKDLFWGWMEFYEEWLFYKAFKKACAQWVTLENYIM